MVVGVYFGKRAEISGLAACLFMSIFMAFICFFSFTYRLLLLL